MAALNTNQYNALDVVVGGQFGSEAKGRVTLEQIRRRIAQAPDRPVNSMRVGGPNAGHVVLDPQGRRWAMRALPVGFVEHSVGLFIAAGSEVDLEVLRDEIVAVERAGYLVRNRLFIHPEATVLEPEHIYREKTSDLTARLGSTAKGIGAARSDRIWRTARRVVDVLDRTDGLNPNELGVMADFDSLFPANWASDAGMALVIEGTQGYGLGLHAGYYPQCTSGDCRAVDVLAQAGVGPWHLINGGTYAVHVVVRPFPIRVAGNSGELAGETTWGDLGLPDERTTVTNKVRRVGTFNPSIVRAAMIANGPAVSRLHLSMADQLAPELAGETSVEVLPKPVIDWIDQMPYSNRVATLGTGPDSCIEFALAHQ